MKNQLKRIIVAFIATVLTAVSITGTTVSADVADNSTDYVLGDVNADDKFTIADVILFQSWLMGNDVTLDNFQAAEFCEDGVLDVFDLCMMKKELLTYCLLKMKSNWSSRPTRSERSSKMPTNGARPLH